MTERPRTSRSETPLVDAAEEDPDVDELSDEGSAEARQRVEEPEDG